MKNNKSAIAFDLHGGHEPRLLHKSLIPWLMLMYWSVPAQTWTSHSLLNIFLLVIVLQLRQKAKKQKHRFSGEMQKVQVN